MPYTVIYVEDSDHVCATLADDIGEQELNAARGEMNSMLLAHDCRRLLVDATGVSEMLSFTTDFEFTEQHRTELPLGTRHAVVIAPEHAEHMRFVEDVAQNRSIILELFTDKDQAVDWLCSEAS